jgi:hypothetical protein
VQFVKQREARFCSSRASPDLTADARRRQGWVKAGGAARRGSLDAVAARGRMLTEVESGVVQSMVTALFDRWGHQVPSPGPKHASGQRRGRACLSFLRRMSAWSVAATNQAGSIRAAATPASEGHDSGRPRAQLVSDGRHAVGPMALERMVPSRRP